MTKEEYGTCLVKTFIAFCRTVIRNTATDCHRKNKTRCEREKSLFALSESELESLSIKDTYDLYRKEYDVLGETVIVHDTDLGEALQYLQPQLRNIVLMRHFLDMSNTEIANKLNISNSTVAYRLEVALKQLKEQMLSMNNLEPV